MIDLYYWSTPNGNKPLLLLEELQLAYKIVPIHIGRGEQFAPEFLAISPNNRIPAIVDADPPGGGAPVSVFESGAILLYLAQKGGRFFPADMRARYECLQWLMWQVGGQGPMFGQAHHFRAFADKKIPYAIERYTNETTRLYNVLNTRLKGRDFVAGDYSIADMAIYPWTLSYERQGQDIAAFPEVAAWQERIAAREATQRVMAIVAEFRGSAASVAEDPEAKKHLYGQTDARSPAAKG